jgi:predicted dinucleotide-binding enzyme
MKYAIIFSGEIGTALACIFARKDIEVAIATHADLRRWRL